MIGHIQMNDEFGNRMKGYEKCSSTSLPDRMPVILRLDGRAFHTLTRRKFDRPFDERFHVAMVFAARKLCQDVSNCRIAYTQSDEVSLLLYPKSTTSQMWLGNKIQKTVSIAAGVMSAAFLAALIAQDVIEMEHFGDADQNLPAFDARVFVIPVFEVKNYFWWRQSDAIRNSVSMLARIHFSSRELHKKNVGQMKQMLFEDKGISWDQLEMWKKQGTNVVKEDSGWTTGNAPHFLDTKGYFDPLIAQPSPPSFIEVEQPGAANAVILPSRIGSK